MLLVTNKDFISHSTGDPAMHNSKYKEIEYVLMMKAKFANTVYMLFLRSQSPYEELPSKYPKSS